jgi:hypothetical protein
MERSSDGQFIFVVAGGSTCVTSVMWQWIGRVLCSRPMLQYILRLATVLSLLYIGHTLCVESDKLTQT